LQKQSALVVEKLKTLFITTVFNFFHFYEEVTARPQNFGWVRAADLSMVFTAFCGTPNLEKATVPMFMATYSKYIEKIMAK
jgi:hypothetical protein